jgi:hypothetical protein
MIDDITVMVYAVRQTNLVRYRIRPAGLSLFNLITSANPYRGKSGRVDTSCICGMHKEPVFYRNFQSGKNYQIFYCLENKIIKMISDAMNTTVGDDWWKTKVPQHKKDEVKKRIKDEARPEQQSAQTMIDYTTFGELSTTRTVLIEL